VKDVTLFKSFVTLSVNKEATFVLINIHCILKLKIMKKSILTMALFAFMIGTIATSYGYNLDNKSVKTNENIQEVSKQKIDAKQELKETKKDTVSEFKKFKKESELKIKSIDNSIGDLKVYFYKNKVKDKEAFQNNLNLIEQKYDNVKKKLTDFNIKGQTQLTSFKLEFNHDLDELGKAVKDFRTKNNK